MDFRLEGLEGRNLILFALVHDPFTLKSDKEDLVEFSWILGT